MPDTLACSFCRKTQREGARLMAGPPQHGVSVYICEECIAAGAAVMAEADRDWRRKLIERLKALP